jgi:hypothetical protein
MSCDDFIGRSFASYLFDNIPLGSLGSNTIYFSFHGRGFKQDSLLQGWTATVLNLIMNGVTVFMVVDEEEAFESANKQWASSSLLLRGFSPRSFPH